MLNDNSKVCVAVQLLCTTDLYTTPLVEKRERERREGEGEREGRGGLSRHAVGLYSSSSPCFEPRSEFTRSSWIETREKLITPTGLGTIPMKYFNEKQVCSFACCTRLLVTSG